MTSTDVTGTNFDRAVLDNADLRGAKMNFAKFGTAKKVGTLFDK